MKEPAKPIVISTEPNSVITFAGGITWVDATYDEKIGAAFKPLDCEPVFGPDGRITMAWVK